MSEIISESKPKSMNNDLLGKVLEFNLYPVRYIHSSWLKDIKYGQVVRSLAERNQTHSWLSNYLLGYFELNETFDYEFSSLEKRVALTSRDELFQLILYIGIILNVSVIRSVVRRDERVKLEQCLGDDAYLFAVKKAQFLSRQNTLGAPMILIDWGNTERFKSFLMVSGLQILAVVYADMPEAFKKRISLKFPKSWSKHLERPASDSCSREQGLNLLMKSYKEVNRQWRHLLS